MPPMSSFVEDAFVRPGTPRPDSPGAPQSFYDRTSIPGEKLYFLGDDGGAARPLFLRPGKRRRRRRALLAYLLVLLLSFLSFTICNRIWHGAEKTVRITGTMPPNPAPTASPTASPTTHAPTAEAEPEPEEQD